MSKRLIFSFVCFISVTLYAQTTNILTFNGGINSTALRDKGMSPLVYSGIGWSAELGYERYKGNKAEFASFTFDQTGIYNSEGNSCNYMAFRLKNFTFYGLDKEATGIPVYFGWSNNNVQSFFEHNSFGNFSFRRQYFTAFGPAAYAKYDFSLFKRDFEVSMTGDMQLLGFYLRPSYLTDSPEGFLDPDNSYVQAFFSSIYLFAPGKAWNFTLNPSLNYALKSGTKLSLSYRYEFTKFENIQPFTESQGHWLFTVKTILK